MTEAKNPEQCETMAEVRAGVDDLDRQIVALLARRFGYMDAAARIKTDRATVRDEERKAEVIGKVQEAARENGIDPELIGNLYDQLIEASIAHELRRFDGL
jgi:isochorismate pyruvate lyase